MRVLALASSYPKHGRDGTAPFIRAISHGLIEHGVGVDLLIPDHPALDWPDGDPPVNLYTHRYLPRGAPRDWYSWGYGRGLRDDRDIRASALAFLPSAATSALVHLVNLGRALDPEVLHAHWLLPAGPIVAAAASLLRKPYLVSLHGSGAFLAERHAWLSPVAKYTLRHAERVTACSSDLAQRAISLGADTTRLATIPYGVDAEDFRPRDSHARKETRNKFDIDEDHLLAIAIGRLVAKKGFEHLVDALVGCPDIELLIAGGGDGRVELLDRVEARGLSNRIRLIGPVSHDAVTDLLAAADILAVPSVVDAAGNVDGLPNVVLEGMAAGVPIVASQIAGIPDVIRHEVNGLLVEPAQPEALRKALIRMSSDEALRTRLGREARRDVEARLRWDIITGRYAKELRRAAPAGPR